MERKTMRRRLTRVLAGTLTLAGAALAAPAASAGGDIVIIEHDRRIDVRGEPIWNRPRYGGPDYNSPTPRAAFAHPGGPPTCLAYDVHYWRGRSWVGELLHPCD
ncbi:hypothetical protein QNA08_06150 [Chelatococcus sp. SYSU_G07232]|uniref:Secreted protein n=1 Tax=Chelatococcus albus TaxID=3047466 RepID=A0ABT7AGP3_9HYPH|nr:hypothetical protein [Chelatococcus sp. SYSU_G07232]MDJ1157811.1 hypothetical protein [Chelatococcus sp. SYSU_G07232]